MADKKIKPNWIKIRTEYETSNTSYRKLAEKYCVSFNTLQDRAKREQWTNNKEHIHDKITTKTRQKVVEKISDIESDINASHYETWELLHKLIKTSVQKEAISVINPNTGEPVEIDRDTKDLDNIAKALDKLQKGQRLAKGMLSKYEAQKLKNDKQKAELELKKFDKEEQQAQKDKDIKIVLEGSLLEWGG